MMHLKSNKLILIITLLFFLCLPFICLTSNAFGMNVKTETYVVIHRDKAGSGLQPAAIKRAIKLSLKKAVKKLIGNKKFSNKQNNHILESKIYSEGLKYIYSFKILKAGEYLNLYYINIKTHIRSSVLISELKTLGFHIVKQASEEKKVDYGVYFIKFVGDFNNHDSTVFQNLMIKYSHHLKNLYISSFSENFDEIKVLYYGNIIRLLKRVRPVIKSYLNAKIYPVKNNTIIIKVIRNKQNKQKSTKQNRRNQKK